MEKIDVRKYADDLLLIIELPFYPLVYSSLKKNLSTKEGRQKLFVRSAGFVPFRRLHMYILGHMYMQANKEYKSESYNDFSGFLLDLRHHVANRFFINRVFKGNYRHALESIDSLLKNPDHGIKAIIDFGSGTGILARAVAESVKDKNIDVIGLDLREETTEFNRLIPSKVTWDAISNTEKYKQKYGAEHIAIISNGVINFMSQTELEAMLSHKFKYFIWFYQTSLEDVPSMYDHKEYILTKESDHYAHYNLGLFLRDKNYSFDYKYFPHVKGQGNFIYGISEYKGT